MESAYAKTAGKVKIVPGEYVQMDYSENDVIKYVNVLSKILICKYIFNIIMIMNHGI